MKEDESSRVLVVASMIPPAHSGAGYSALKYATRLEARGALGFLLTAAPRPEDDWELDDRNLMRVLRERTCRVGGKHPRKMDTGVGLLVENVARCLRTFQKFRLERKRFTIVHCFSPTWLSFFACLAAKLYRKKLIVEITLLGGDCPESVTHNRLRILHQRKMLQFKLADAVVCVSPALKQVCLRAGIPEEKLPVIPRAVNARTFCPVGSERKIRLRKQLGLPEEIALILFVGGIHVRKGIDLLLPAFRQLAGADPNVGLVVVGPSYKTGEASFWHKAILDARDDPGLKGRLIYPGWKSNINEFMQAADIFVLPSRQEGFCNVLVEAMSSGLPVVGLEIPGMTDFIVEDGENGYIVNEATPEALASGLGKALAGCRRGEKRIGENARKTAVTRFSPESVDAAYQKLYRDVMRMRSPGGH